MLLWYPKNDTYPEKQQFDNIPTNRKITKKFKNSKKSILYILADSGRNDDIWPEIGLLDPLNMFYKHIWYQGSYICDFEKIEKIDFFENFWWPTNENVSQFYEIGHKSAEYYARSDQTPLDPSQKFLRSIIRLCLKCTGNFAKNAIFTKNALYHT